MKKIVKSSLIAILLAVVAIAITGCGLGDAQQAL